MRRSPYRRAAARSGGNRRILAVGAVIAALGAVIAFTTISNASTTPSTPPGSDAGKIVNGQAILTDTCVDSKLPAHTGFQDGNRCVSTEFGEVGTDVNNPSLLITQAPRSVAVNTPFTLKVSTRNLIRDRFLAAGKGGYYVESSVLKNGLVRGHFHTACRMLSTTKLAPAPDPVPAFFVATEDTKGGAAPDVVTIQVPGLPAAGIAQCASWAGDGSHRVPMMQRANQTPPIDAVRIVVSDGGGNNGGGNTGNTGGNTGNTGGNTGNTGNGGNNNGGGATTPPTTPPATAPTKAGSTTGPTTKGDFTPNTTPPTVKPVTTHTTKPATKAADPTPSRTADSVQNEPAATETESPTATTTTAAKPKASSKAAAAGSDFTYSNDDGEANSGTKAPDPAQVAAAAANANANAKQQSGPLALTGTNTVAFIGAGVVLLLVGLSVMALTRRRRVGNGFE